MISVVRTVLAVMAANMMATDGRGGALAARILGVFLHHGYSHHMVFLPYIHALADRGHEVHVISNFPTSHPKVTDISIEGSMPMHNNNLTFPMTRQNSLISMWNGMFALYDWAKSTEAVFDVPAVKQLLDDPDAAFDLVIAEHFNSELSLGFAAKYDTPFVLLTSCPIFPWAMSLFGQSFEVAHRPSTFSGLSGRMDLSQRMVNALITYVSNALFLVLHRPWSQQTVKKRLGLDVSLDEFASNASLMLVNTHWTVSGVSTTVPAVVEVGGMHIKPSKSLPEVSTYINTRIDCCFSRFALRRKSLVHK